MVLPVRHVGEPLADETVDRQVGGDLVEVVGDAIAPPYQLHHVLLFGSRQYAILNEIGEGALQLLVLRQSLIGFGLIVFGPADAPTPLHRHGADHIPLQLFGMVEDQDHLERAMPDQAALKLRQSAAKRIGEMWPRPGAIAAISRHGLGTRTS
jgi:hypothetical protein